MRPRTKETEGRGQRFLDLAIERKIYHNRVSLVRHLNYMYGSTPLAGKNILDVGGGVGLLSFYAAIQGANAICLEPEFDGSSTGMIERFNQFSVALGDGVAARLETLTFQEFSSKSLFDVILLANSINHLDEENCQRLHIDETARQAYLGIFQKMFNLLRPGGRVIMTDCDRSNAFHQLGLTNPLMKSIEWHKHQSPHLWMSLLRRVGFEPVSVQWTAPNVLGKVGRFILGNRFVAYFLLSHFRLEVTKPVCSLR